MEPHHMANAHEFDPGGDVHQLGLEKPAPSEDFVRLAELVKVVDGDTLRLQIDMGWSISSVTDVRLANVNTPENRGPERPAGLWVSEQVRNWIRDQQTSVVMLRSERFSLGKFGRCVCNIWMGGKSLNHWLLSRKYAWPTDDDGSMIGAREIDHLAIPDEIKLQVRAVPS